MSAFRRTFRLEKPLRGTIADAAHPKPQTLISRWNLLGCHGIASVKEGFGRPQTGSALHHLVTSVSVKKALMGLMHPLMGRLGRVPGPQVADADCNFPQSSQLLMLPAHSRPKCVAAADFRIARMAL
jgi:hypothetical protein